PCLPVITKQKPWQQDGGQYSGADSRSCAQLAIDLGDDGSGGIESDERGGQRGGPRQELLPKHRGADSRSCAQLAIDLGDDGSGGIESDERRGEEEGPQQDFSTKSGEDNERGRQNHEYGWGPLQRPVSPAPQNADDGNDACDDRDTAATPHHQSLGRTRHGGFRQSLVGVPDGLTEGLYEVWEVVDGVRAGSGQRPRQANHDGHDRQVPAGC